MKNINFNIDTKIRCGFNSECYVTVNISFYTNIMDDIRNVFYLPKELQEYSLAPSFFNDLKLSK